MLIGAVGGKNRNQPVIAPPWGLFEKNVVAFLPWPSRNVRAKCHGNSTLCAWVWAFSSKRTTPANFGSRHSQSGRRIKNLKYTFLSNGYRDTMYRFVWFLDKKRRSTVQKCVLDKSACWWRCNRPMWKVGGLGASAAPRECACKVSLPSCQPSLRFGVHKAYRPGGDKYKNQPAGGAVTCPCGKSWA